MPAAKATAVEHISEIQLESDSRSASRRSCCSRKRVLLALAAILAIALGLGLGIGLSQQAKSTTTLVTQGQAGNDNLATTTSRPAAQSTTHAGSVATASAAPKSGVATTSCPASNGTTYQASGHSYLLLCGADVQASNKVDLGRVYKPSFNECIDACASLGANRTDVSAVYWVDYNEYDRGTCWCFGGTSRADGAAVSVWAANNLAWVQS